jgi:hypothetical protein
MAPPCLPLSKVTASRSDIGSTNVYLHADMTLKERALALTTPDSIPPGRYRPTEHGYSRAGFYLVASTFDQSGMAGLVDERRGRRGPVKLHPEIVEFIRAEGGSGAQTAEQVADRFGVRLHRRTVERVRER